MGRSTWAITVPFATQHIDNFLDESQNPQWIKESRSDMPNEERKISKIYDIGDGDSYAVIVFDNGWWCFFDGCFDYKNDDDVEEKFYCQAFFDSRKIPVPTTVKECENQEKENVKPLVYMINESPYASIGREDHSLFADDEKWLKKFCKDFALLGKIKKNKALQQTL